MKRKTGPSVFGALALSFVMAGLYFIIAYQNIPFIYDINDDVAMRNVASGVITGTPDAHLLHIKYILGLVISGLYGLLPGLDWYGIILIGMILFAFGMVLYRGLSAEKGVLWKGAYVLLSFLLMTCMGLQHIAAFQWTTAAAFSGAAGIYLFYTADKEDGWKTWMEEGIAVFLLLLALAVRDDVFLMMLPVSGLCFWWKYGSICASAVLDKTKRKLSFSLEHKWIPVSLLAGVMVILAFEAAAYRSPQWKEFRAYNTDREAIMDYYEIHNYEEAAEFYSSLGMSPEETEDLQRYSLYLAGDLYSENMDKIAEREKQAYQQEHSFSERMKSAFSGVYTHLKKDTYHPANLITLCVIALALGVSIGAEDKKQQLFMFCFLGIWAVYWLYLGYRNRLLERVGFALYLLAFFTVLAVWYRVTQMKKEGEQLQKKWTERIGGGLLTFGVCFVLSLSAFFTWQSVEINNTGRRDYNLRFLEVNAYMAAHPDNVYFMTTYSIETYTDNFSLRRSFEFSNLLSLGGWHTFSPLENEKCRRLGITDPKQDIVENDKVYVISLSNVNLRYMDRYFESIYGEQYLGRELVDVLDYGDQSFEVYDFSNRM